MGYHRKNQEKAGTLGFMRDKSPGMVTAYSTHRAMGCQRIFKDGTQWKLYNHEDGSSHTNVDGEYNPNYVVKGVKVEGASGQIHYDMPFDDGDKKTNQSNHCLDTFAPYGMHNIQLTKLYLDALTTADAITLFY